MRLVLSCPQMIPTCLIFPASRPGRGSTRQSQILFTKRNKKKGVQTYPRKQGNENPLNGKCSHTGRPGERLIQSPPVPSPIRPPLTRSPSSTQDQALPSTAPSLLLPRLGYLGREWPSGSWNLGTSLASQSPPINSEHLSRAWYAWKHFTHINSFNPTLRQCYYHPHRKLERVPDVAN